MTDADLLEKVKQARKRLLLDYPWFGTLALMLQVEISDKPKYAAHTDGTVIRFRQDYVEQASLNDLVMLWAHEIVHCALLHPYRRGSRDNAAFNEAADYATNQILKSSGMEIPSNWLYDPQYDNMSAESIYAKRQREKAQKIQTLVSRSLDLAALADLLKIPAVPSRTLQQTRATRPGTIRRRIRK